MSYWDWIASALVREQTDYKLGRKRPSGLDNSRPSQSQSGVVVSEALTDEEVAGFTSNWLSLQLTMQRSDSPSLEVMAYPAQRKLEFKPLPYWCKHNKQRR